jgi:hypothetical protein
VAHDGGHLAGVTWLLDGLEGNLAGALAGILKLPKTLGMSDAQIGLSSTLSGSGDNCQGEGTERALVI